MNLNCRGRLLDLAQPKVMGVLNCTPDSFYDGGRYEGQSMEAQVDKMISEGVDIIDVGGMSSKPGAEIISVIEEIRRVKSALEYIVKEHPTTLVSVDTLQSKVAERALDLGAHMVNDISGGNHDEKIIKLCVKNDAPYIMMHMQGKPSTMQEAPTYDDVVLDILKSFNVQIKKYRAQGMKDIIIDPGFGFGKSVQHNYQLLAGLSAFRITECPVLVGVSRKSMLYKPLDISPLEALSATTAAHMIALHNGANILRVHDVKEAKQCIQIFQMSNGIF